MPVVSVGSSNNDESYKEGEEQNIKRCTQKSIQGRGELRCSPSRSSASRSTSSPWSRGC